MKKTTKQLIVLMLILGVGCILEGCRKESNHSVTITLIHAWGGTEEDHVAMREIYEEFQEENPDINLQMISMPTREDMMRKVEDMIMVGNIPDIVSFSGTGKNSTYDFMIENNMALDIYPYMQQDQEFADSVSEVNKQYWSTETGELYSVADALMLSGGYWYNEDILKAAGIEKVPKSWDEFQTMCEQISEWALNEKNEVKALQPTAEGYLYCMDHMLAGSEDSRFEGHNLIFQDEIFNNAINRMKRMYNSAISENAEYSYRDETHLFNEGKLAIYINGDGTVTMPGTAIRNVKIKDEYAQDPYKSKIKEEYYDEVKAITPEFFGAENKDFKDQKYTIQVLNAYDYTYVN